MCVCVLVRYGDHWLFNKNKFSLWTRTIWLLFLISMFSMMRLSLNHALKYVSINFSVRSNINMRIVQGIHDILSIFTWSVLILVCHSIAFHFVLIFMRINFIIIHKSMIFQWQIRVCLRALFQLFIFRVFWDLKFVHVNKETKTNKWKHKTEHTNPNKIY